MRERLSIKCSGSSKIRRTDGPQYGVLKMDKKKIASLESLQEAPKRKYKGMERFEELVQKMKEIQQSEKSSGTIVLEADVKKNRKFGEEVLASLEKQGLQVSMRAKAKEYGIDLDSVSEALEKQRKETEDGLREKIIAAINDGLVKDDDELEVVSLSRFELLDD